MNPEILKNLKHNMTVNLLDGAVFGFAAGFASFVTILPLFMRTLTSSPILIGLIPAIHAAGWQLPQIFTAGWITRRRRVTPLVIALTSQERLPYLGLALAAFFLPRLGAPATLAITFALLVWQGLGAGFTANPWQSMIAKIIPGERRGTFFGIQAGLTNLLASIGAVIAGLILGRVGTPWDFTWCFLICFGLLIVSWIFMALTREPASPPPEPDESALPHNAIGHIGGILRKDLNFRWFLIARAFSQLAIMGYAFYAIYAVDHHGVREVQIGLMTGALMGSQVVANIAMGWLGDRIGHRYVMEFGLVAMAISALLAWWAPAPGWFFLVFILAAIGNVALWTVALSMTLEYGTESERPIYIGMTNTLTAPANILAPFLGGWLANSFGFPATFAASAIGGLLAAGIFHLFVRKSNEGQIRA
jgi:MFS family permease